MNDLRNVIIVKNVPVKDASGEHGRDIGYIYGQFEPFTCTVDFALEDDAWVPITNPITWRETGKVGWVKKAWCVMDEDPSEARMLVTYYRDGRAPTVKVVG